MRSSIQWIGRLGVLLAVVGALNWGLVGLFEWNLVGALFGDGTALVASTAERLLYILVGVGGVLAIPMLGGSLRGYASGTNVRSIGYRADKVGRRAA